MVPSNTRETGGCKVINCDPPGPAHRPAVHSSSPGVQDGPGILAGFLLEGATSLAPSPWTALNVLSLPEGTNYTVTAGTGGNALSFRLHHL
jgi:hypothetical protein